MLNDNTIVYRMHQNETRPNEYWQNSNNDNMDENAHMAYTTLFPSSQDGHLVITICSLNFELHPYYKCFELRIISVKFRISEVAIRRKFKTSVISWTNLPTSRMPENSAYYLVYWRPKWCFTECRGRWSISRMIHLHRWCKYVFALESTLERNRM